MFSNTEVIVAQIVMAQCVVASLSLSVISHTTNLRKLTNLPKLMIKFQKQKLFKDNISKAISAFAQNNGSSAEH